MQHPDNWPSPQDAFEAAIQMGFLSADEAADNCAGHYMFMGCDDDGTMLFKHCDTRRTYRCE